MTLKRDEIVEEALIEESRNQRAFFERVTDNGLYPWQRDVLTALANHKGPITFTRPTGKSVMLKEVERIREQVHKTFKIPKDML